MKNAFGGAETRGMRTCTRYTPFRLLAPPVWGAASTGASATPSPLPSHLHLLRTALNGSVHWAASVRGREAVKQVLADPAHLEVLCRRRACGRCRRLRCRGYSSSFIHSHCNFAANYHVNRGISDRDSSFMRRCHVFDTSRCECDEQR